MEDKRFSPILLSLLLFFATSAGLFAQQPSNESFDAPVVLTRVVTYFVPYDVTKQELAQDFGPDNFQVQVGGVAAQVESVLIENGPKRMVLVLDAGKPVPKDEYDENIYVAKALLAYARSKDRFTVLLVGSDAPTAKFISPGETKRYLEKLCAARPPTTEPGTRIYDTLLAAAKNLDPPQFGDVVILFGRLEDSGSKATMEDLSGAFVREKLRFFGISFAPHPNLQRWNVSQPQRVIQYCWNQCATDGSWESGNLTSNSGTRGSRSPIVLEFRCQRWGDRT
jgi:hypothetical protein